MSKPIIGILCNKAYTEDVIYPFCYRYYINQEYLETLQGLGAMVVSIPPTNDNEDLEQLLEPLDGLIIPGGNDIDPLLYMSEPTHKMGTIVGDIDRFYIRAFEVACSLRIPVFGVCKGLQLINVALGGTLIQDIPQQVRDAIVHTQSNIRSYPSHMVDVEPDSFLNSLGQDKLLVNSHHHQAIDELGFDLKVAARASDGIIEAIEHETLPVYAVQWHPEMMCAAGDELSTQIWKDFLERCGK